MSIDPLALSVNNPVMSAATPLVLRQKICIAAGSLGLTILAVLFPGKVALVFIAASTVFYAVFSLYKLLLVRMSATAGSEVMVTPEQMESIDVSSLPVYSVLVPLYREPETVRDLVEALDGLDYPADRKDVQLLLEEDDDVTRAAVAQIALPRGFNVTLIPPSHPRTKPKACNIGLAGARGKYLVIYDAEDRPEPDQLKKAVVAFNGADAATICFQSRLNFYNPRRNLLTRWFAAEYSAWFDLSLPGLSALNSVIPLGGTSNHFVTEKLREMMGWDAYNVTEDCDLGVRIARCGYRSRMLHTTTWEEACGSLPFWIRQRTRWLKGYIQTYLVHMRQPVRLMRELGIANFLHFQALVGGIVFSFLINPLFWFMAVLWFSFRLQILTSLFPGPVFAVGAVCLFLGNFIFVYICVAACYNRGLYDLVKYALLTPVYWLLMSWSGWRAFFQFFGKPFVWEKTRHGLSVKR